MTLAALAIDRGAQLLAEAAALIELGRVDEARARIDRALTSVGQLDTILSAEKNPQNEVDHVRSH